MDSNNNLNDLTLIGNFIFCDETTFDNQNGNQFLEAIPRSFITKYATLDETLQHIKTFYMFMEDYCYSIVNSASKGHKLYITKSEDSGQMLSVYSTNYHEIMSTQNITFDIIKDELRNVKDKDEYFKKISIEFQNRKNR